MQKAIRYKAQGDGRDSWEIKEFDDEGQLISAYMIYEDPYILPIPSVDVLGLLKSLSSKELIQIKQLLNT